MAKSRHSAYFVEHSDAGFIIARTTGYDQPLTLEEVCEAPAEARDEIVSLVESMGGASGAAGYTRARCGVYPQGRLLGKLSIDEPRRAKDPNYLEDRVKSEFNIEPSAYHLAVLSPRTGAPADIGSLMEKEFFICGAPIQAFSELQKEILKLGVFPDRLELGSVSSIGALVDYHRYAGFDAPTLVLEIGRRDTRVVIIHRDAMDAVRTISSGLQSMIAVVQRDLGLKDDEAARRLFYSDSFDFKEMGPRLVDRLLREIQSTVGYYEVSTGLSVGQVLCTKAPNQLAWLNKTFAKALNVDPLILDIPGWLDRNGVSLGSGIQSENVPAHWLGLLGLLIEAVVPDDETK